MNQTHIYGKLESEKRAEENIKARQIVKVINDYGISNRERWLIIKALALEIEEFDKMQDLLDWLRNNVPSVFIAHGDEENGKIDT